MTVQTCVKNQQGVVEFLKTTRALAKSERLKFVDGSQKTRDALKTMGANKNIKYDISQTLNIALKDGNVIRVMIGNLGLPPYQIVISFFGDHDDIATRRLSKNLVKDIAQRWHIETVAQGKGALPMETCGS